MIKITIGNGAGDAVKAFTSSHDTITLGNGDRDTVYADCSNHDTIILGNGAGARVDADIDNFGLWPDFMSTQPSANKLHKVERVGQSQLPCACAISFHELDLFVRLRHMPSMHLAGISEGSTMNVQDIPTS